MSQQYHLFVVRDAGVYRSVRLVPDAVRVLMTGASCSMTALCGFRWETRSRSYLPRSATKYGALKEWD